MKTFKKVIAFVLLMTMIFGTVLNTNAAVWEGVFDAEAYASKYDDLKNAFGNDYNALLTHFKEYGQKEGRLMTELLDVKKYREAYPDLDLAFGDDYDAYFLHYTIFGAKEGRDSFTDFNPYAYADRYTDLKEAFGYDVLALYDHYMTYGRKEGRNPSKPISQIRSSQMQINSEVPNEEVDDNTPVEMRGTLIDPDTGLPIPNARIQVTRIGDLSSSISIERTTVLAMSDKLVTVAATSFLSSLSNLLSNAITSTVSGGDLGDTVSSGDLGDDVSSGDLGEDDPFTVYTDEDGNYVFPSLLPGTYSAEVTAEGYIGLTIDNIEVRRGEVTYVEQTVLLSENTAENGTSKIAGKIIDALTGNGLANVTLELYSGWGTMQGTAVTTITSDESGNYEVSLERGYYTIKAMKEEYISIYKNVISFTNYNTREQNIAITPILLSDDEYRIVLTWGATPSDLDSHIVGPKNSGEGDFHVYYSNKKYEYEDVVYAELDVDDTSSYGPETITLIKPIIDGTYKYSVHDYSNDSGEQVALDANREMALSGAVVKVYKGTELLRTYQVPTDQTGIVWNVFELKNDVITTLNTMTGEYDAIFMTY